MVFNGKTVIVTGAAGGMGKAVVELLLKEGANVVACDLNTELLEDFKGKEDLIVYESNLLDEETVRHIFQETKRYFGSIDGLANVLGIAQGATPIDECSLEQYHSIMDVNMKSIFLTCREAALYMKKQRQGKIVNVGSVSTTRPRPGLQIYIASKGAVESFSKALALELAPYHINVNILHPGPSDTNMLEKFSKNNDNMGDTFKDEFANSIPLGRLLQPEDIANSVKFLLSDKTDMVTGSVLHVDGGRNI